MKILAVDVGTGTQDILLFDSRLDVENSYKLVLPSPTMMVHRRLQQATRAQRAVLLSGHVMGGGPSQWAAEAHARAGLPIYATPQAALSFNDDLSAIEAMGIRVVSEDDIGRLPGDPLQVEMRDFDLPAIRSALELFGVSLEDLNAVAVAVFDHGAAPLDVSDRQFRFDYLDERIRAENRLSAFAYLSHQIPPILTRLQAVADSAGPLEVPLVVMDTAPAAVLGASLDPRVAALPRSLVANVGNFHTLAFRMGPQGIEGVFEHHTGLLTQPDLESLLLRLADGSLRHARMSSRIMVTAPWFTAHPLILDPVHREPGCDWTRRRMLRSIRSIAVFCGPLWRYDDRRLLRPAVCHCRPASRAARAGYEALKCPEGL
jgi:uncharacterized protein (DUF1786 family)